jgi:hypothetical protein
MNLGYISELDASSRSLSEMARSWRDLCPAVAAHFTVVGCSCSGSDDDNDDDLIINLYERCIASAIVRGAH